MFLSGLVAKSEAYLDASQTWALFEKPAPQKAWRPASRLGTLQSVVVYHSQ